jgi:hypothetical protein
MNRMLKGWRQTRRGEQFRARFRVSTRARPRLYRSASVRLAKQDLHRRQVPVRLGDVDDVA